MTRLQVNFVPRLIRTIKKTKSQVNGNIDVEEREGIGILLNVGGLSQSGGAVKKVWDHTLRFLTNLKPQAKSCLILGLGGGSLVNLLKNHYPNIKITGVELDPVMIRLGKKYFGLNEKDTEILIEDANYYVSLKPNTESKKFDLILIDIYIGRSTPEKFNSEKFINTVRTLLNPNGIVIFNRVNLFEDETGNRALFQRLQKIFPRVIPHFINDNLAIICFEANN